MKVLSFLLVLTMGFAIHPLFGQLEDYIGRMEEELSLAKHDTMRVRILNNYIGAILRADLDKGKEQMQFMDSLSKAQNYAWGFGQLRFYEGQLELTLGNNEKAKEKYEQALAIGERINDTLLILDATGSIGIAWMRMGNIKKGMEYQFLALEKSQFYQDSLREAQNANDLGVIYNENGEWDKALQYYVRALHLYQGLNDFYSEAITLANIGATYMELKEYHKAIEALEESSEELAKSVIESDLAFTNAVMGICHRHLKEFDLSIEKLKKAEKIMSVYGNDSFLADIKHYLGSTYLDMGDYPRARKYFTESLEIKRELQAPKGIIIALNSIGSTYEKEGNPALGLRYLKEAEAELAENPNTQLEEILSETFVNTYENMNQPAQALAYAKRLQKARDSLLNEQRINRLALLQADYEYLQKEKEILILNSEKEIAQLTLGKRNRERVFLFALLALALGLVALLYNRYKLKIQAQRKLEELDELRASMVSNISHEIRNPLSLILGPLEQRLEKASQKEETEDLEVMKQNTLKLTHLADQLLEAVKIERGHMALKLMEADIIPFLKSIFIAYHSRATDQMIDYSYSFSTQSRICLFDPEKVDHIINNLLSNAFKYTPSGSFIKLRVEENGPQMDIIVQDGGPGIPPSEIPKIFDRFYRISDSSLLQEGLGIGLAMVKKLAELHMGSIEVESEDGKGSRFVFSFPLNASVYEGEIRLSKEEEPFILSTDKRSPLIGLEQRVGDQPMILLVEDEREMRKLVKGILGNEYLFVEAENGAQALEIAKQEIPDLIISDVKMPTMDGMEFLTQLRENEKTSHIPVVMLTARADEASQLSGIERGASAYLTKPFRQEELRTSIVSLLKQREKLKEYYQKFITLEPEGVELDSLDAKFLKKALAIVEANIENAGFKVGDLQEELAMSKTQLHRKLKALTQKSGNEFIRNIRIKKAAQYLQAGSHTVSEVAYMVGFNNLSYFAKCFKQQFGKNPSEFVKGQQE